MPSRKMARSIAAIRSSFQCTACFATCSSANPTSFAAPSNSAFANSRVVSDAFALFQNFVSSFLASWGLISDWNNICIAYSRAFARNPTLGPPPFLFRRRARTLAASQLPRKPRHLNRRESCLKALVPALQPRAVNRLLQRIHRHHAENHWDSRVHLRQLQSSRSLRANILVMRRLPANDAANRNQRVIFSRQRKLLARQWQFE